MFALHEGNEPIGGVETLFKFKDSKLKAYTNDAFHIFGNEHLRNLTYKALALCFCLSFYFPYFKILIKLLI